MKHFLSIEATSPADLEYLVQRGLDLKAQRRTRTYLPLANQNWALVFTKSSTRTRVSFEVGLRELGAYAMFFSGRDLHLGRGEPIRDTARVLGRMVDGAIIRTYEQEEVESFASLSGIPTINALTDAEHPCQIIADMVTIREAYDDWRDRRICFLGDGDCNMARSWLWTAKHLDLDFVLCAPEEYTPPADFMAQFEGARIRVESDPAKAVEGADVLYTDVWVSMGKEEESGERIETLKPYQINWDLLHRTGKESIVMHCLPAYREYEITDAVLEANAETIFRQAENRLHAQKAILCWCVEEAATRSL